MAKSLYNQQYPNIVAFSSVWGILSLALWGEYISGKTKNGFVSARN